MAVRRITEPEVEPISLEDAKDHLNIEHDEKDDLIGTYISAARAHIEDACHIVVAESEWELAYDAFPSAAVAVPRYPLISVSSVKYDDADGDEQTLAVEDYFVDASGQFGWIVPIESGWPSTISASNSVRIRFVAGWPNESTVSTVPWALKQATKLLVGHFFDERGDGAKSIPPAVESLIGPYRVPVLA